MSAELRDAIRSTTYVPGAREAFTRYQALSGPPELPRIE